MRKLLWIGDAVVATGFARCTHNVLAEMGKTWDVTVLGLNYLGDPHRLPYPVIPCWPGGDAFGLGRLEKLVGDLKPDVVVVQNDPWNIPAYLKLLPPGAHVVASMPVDGKNCRLGFDLDQLRETKVPHAKLELAVFWTEFGLREARAGGFVGHAAVVPLGVDLDLYKPVDRKTARANVGVEQLGDAFIVGNVNRNQPRKRLDLTIRAFAEWVQTQQVDDAYLFLHVAPTGEQECDVQQLMSYYGFTKDLKRLILSVPDMGHGVDERALSSLYSSFDVQLSTTQGEGWGLTTMEGMACGVPQVVPDYSALGEWAKEAAMLVPCIAGGALTPRANVLGGVPDVGQAALCLDRLYRDKSLRGRLRQRGLALVARPEYRWASVGRAFAAAVEEHVAWKVA